MAAMAISRGERDPEQLLSEYRAAIGSRSTPPMTKPIDMLVDTVTHAQDIRRPLGIAYTVPTDTAIAVADRLKGIGFPLATKKRISGVKLAAIDADWSTGDGPEVRGPIEALIMMMAGRRGADAQLEGEGVATLRGRG
jgi:uncharacterized protein (TIGR03083 family)